MNHLEDIDKLTNIPESVIKLHDDRELMRLASLVGTDARTPELKLAQYIDTLILRGKIEELKEIPLHPNFITGYIDNRIAELESEIEGK